MCRIYAEQDPHRYALTTRRLRLNGQSTSIRLENTYWQILDDLAAAEGMTTPGFMSKLHSEVLEQHGEPANFSSVLRCTCLIYLERTGPQAIAAE
jgi:predicted DNA-binding ribbon-helix-helix protein